MRCPRHRGDVARSSSSQAGRLEGPPPTLGGHRLWWASVAIVTLALLGAPCGEGAGSENETGGDRGNVAGGAERIFVYGGEDALGGSEIQLVDLFQQGRPVVLNFWAGVCPPCRQEMPDFQELYEEHEDEIILIGLDVGQFTQLGSQQDARNLLQELNITYPTGYVESDSLLREYSVFEMPTTVFLTPDGAVFSKHGGFMTGDQMQSQVDALISASQ